MNRHKVYFEKNSQGQFLYMDHTMADWTRQFYETRESHSKFTKLLQENIKEFKRIFGRQNFCTSDSENRRLYVWRLPLKSGDLWLLSGGNGRGTSYEWNPTGDVEWFRDEAKAKLTDIMNQVEESE